MQALAAIILTLARISPCTATLPRKSRNQCPRTTCPVCIPWVCELDFMGPLLLIAHLTVATVRPSCTLALRSHARERKHFVSGGSSKCECELHMRMIRKSVKSCTGGWEPRRARPSAPAAALEEAETLGYMDWPSSGAGSEPA